MEKAQNGHTTVYVGMLYEKHISTGIATTYYFAGSTRVATRQGNTLAWLVGDHLGSTSVRLDSSGNKVGELYYKSFGGTRYSWGSEPTARCSRPPTPTTRWAAWFA